MDFKPGEFFITIVDFFAVLLPGAILIFLSLDWIKWNVLGVITPNIRGKAQGWAAFILSSFLLGHFLHLPGAGIDSIYDKTYRIYQGKRLERHRARLLENSQVKLRENWDNYAPEEETDKLRWATAVIRVKNSNAASDLDHKEAESKFFRGVTIVLLILLIYLLYVSISFKKRKQVFKSKLSMMASLVICMSLLGISFWRYCDRRWKRTLSIYEYYVATEKFSNVGSSKN